MQFSEGLLRAAGRGHFLFSRGSDPGLAFLPLYNSPSGLAGAAEGIIGKRTDYPGVKGSLGIQHGMKKWGVRILPSQGGWGEVGVANPQGALNA